MSLPLHNPELCAYVIELADRRPCLRVQSDNAVYEDSCYNPTRSLVELAARRVLELVSQGDPVQAQRLRDETPLPCQEAVMNASDRLGEWLSCRRFVPEYVAEQSARHILTRLGLQQRRRLLRSSSAQKTLLGECFWSTIMNCFDEERDQIIKLKRSATGISLGIRTQALLDTAASKVSTIMQDPICLALIYLGFAIATFESLRWLPSYGPWLGKFAKKFLSGALAKLEYLVPLPSIRILRGFTHVEHIFGALCWQAVSRLLALRVAAAAVGTGYVAALTLGRKTSERVVARSMRELSEAYLIWSSSTLHNAPTSDSRNM